MPVFSWTIPPTSGSAPPAQVPVAYDAASYARQLKQLLPRGAVWNLEAGSGVNKVLLAIADELARVDARGLNLIDEADPRTANETIADWERMLALPDDRVLVIPATLALRRIAVTQKFVSLGGQSVAFFTALALACGYVITITKFANSVLRVGFRVGARVYGVAYAYAMQINVAAPAGVAMAHADFERVIRHVTHSHIVVIFVYS